MHDLRLEARTDCPACEEDGFARNAWFDGRIVTAADLVTEQDYMLTKHRRHARLLHGQGVVCGLRVVQHPNPDCRAQWVVVQPGSALDCCGREVRVDQPTLFDLRAAFLRAWQAAHGKATPPDAAAHRIEVVLRYAECPAEPVPVLFEGCAPGGQACLPSRVVEGFELDLLLDRPPPDPPEAGASLSWLATIGAHGAMRVRLHAASGRAFILAGDAATTLLVADLSTGAVLGTMADAGAVPLDLAVSPDGQHVFVAVAPAAGDPEIRVLDSAAPAAAPLHVLALPGAAGGGVRLLALPDGRLAAAVSAADEVRVWGSDVTAAPTAVAVAHAPGPLALPSPATHL